MLTALATARAPLTVEQLARGLGWQLPHTAAAIAAAQDNPYLGGPLALQRIPPETWTVTPRLDILTRAQRRALRDTTGAASLDDDQARVLLAAIAAGQSDTYADLRAQPGWTAGSAPKETGLIYSSNSPDEVHVSDDVRFSLRYSNDDHIAASSASPRRWTWPQRTRPEAPGPGRIPASEHPGPGPAATSQPGPGRVPSRRAAAAEARRLTHARPVGRASPRPGPRAITTDARPVLQPGTMNAPSASRKGTET